ncbi:hypothetical protein P7C70_g7204, partial [Phenoliferia sp. Uapishka_3]
MREKIKIALEKQWEGERKPETWDLIVKFHGETHNVLVIDEDSISQVDTTLAKGYSPSQLLSMAAEIRAAEATAREAELFRTNVFEVNAKYKPVAKKVRPVNIPEDTKNNRLDTAWIRPPLSRDPYNTPLSPHMPEFVPGGKLTQDRIDMIDFGPADFLQPQEKNLILMVLRIRENALAFCDDERGRLKDGWNPPFYFPTIPHEPWQEKPNSIPRALRDDVVLLLKERMRTGIYEPSRSPYSSKWFVVLKKNGKLRVIHDYQKLNSITLRDSGMPPIAEEFIESFVGRACYSLCDVYGGYDQFGIPRESRGLMAFQSPMGALQPTVLGQGYTRSVAEYQRRMTFIYAEEMPEFVGFFVDDGGVKGPPSRYDNEAIPENLGIRRFIWEHCVTLERFLFRGEEAGLTFSGAKLAALVPKLELVGTVVSLDGKNVAPRRRNKIERMLDAPPKDPTAVRAIVGLLSTVRFWIPQFGELMAPLRKIVKKDEHFEWTKECQQNTEHCIRIIGKDMMLKGLVYGPAGGKIYLSVDTSDIAAGSVLSQVGLDGREHPARYESITLSDVERRYNGQSKKEMCGVAKTYKKLQHILWGVHHTLRVDAIALIQMLNRPDLPNAPMTHWASFIMLFDFDIEHVPAVKFLFPDWLSRAPRDAEDSEPENLEDVLSVNQASLHNLNASEKLRIGLREVGIWLVEGAYDDDDDWKRLGEYLETFQRPSGLTDKKFQRLKRKSLNYFIRNGRIFRRSHDGSDQGAREVVISPQRQEYFLRTLHEDGGHRGRNETYRRVKNRVWFPKMEKIVREWVRSCDECQKRSAKKEREPLHPTFPPGLFLQVHFDCLHVKEGPYPYIVSARENLSGWIEARCLRKINSKSVAEFIETDLLCRFGGFFRAVVDGGPEFKKHVIETLTSAGVEISTIAPHNSEGNAKVERGHIEITDVLAKVCGNNPKRYHESLDRALFADRTSIQRTTGLSAFQFLYGIEPILPIDITEATWMTEEWHKIHSRVDLIAARCRLLEQKEDRLELARKQVYESRLKGVLYMDRKNAHLMRAALQPGDWVLAQNMRKASQHGLKLLQRWNGPFRVKRRLTKGSYLLMDLDGTRIAKAFASKRLRRYHPRGRLVELVEKEEDSDSEGSESGDEVHQDSSDDEDTRLDQQEAENEVWNQPLNIARQPTPPPPPSQPDSNDYATDPTDATHAGSEIDDLQSQHSTNSTDSVSSSVRWQQGARRRRPDQRQHPQRLGYT